MGQSISGSGDMGKLMARASSSIQMVTTTRVTGATTRLLGMGSISMTMGINMRESGKMMCSTGTGKRDGPMGHPTKGATTRELSMGLGSTSGVMDLSIMDTGTTM